MAPDLDPVPAEATPPTRIDLVVYGEDCIVSGHLMTAAERLSDFLNADESFNLLDVVSEDFAGGPRIALHTVAVARDEVMLVRANSPRGNAARRQHTRQHAIVLKIGPYEVHGYVHAMPGSDVLASIRRRKAMIALTDAFITFSHHSQAQIHHAGVLIVNRDAVDWISQGEAEVVAVPAMPVDSTGFLLKDFTGHLTDAVVAF